MAKAQSFSMTGIMVEGPRGEVEDLLTSNESHLTHNFELAGADGEYVLFGIFPRGSVRQGYVSINPGQVNYFVVTLETPVESQVERVFIQRLGEMIQAKQLGLVPWKDGDNRMVGVLNQAGKPDGLPPFMQPGEIEKFQALPEPGERDVQLTKGMSVSKPSGYWTVVISAPADFTGSNADFYLKQILSAFEEAAAPMIDRGFLAFYRIVNRMTNKVVKQQWSEQGRQRAANEKQAHQAAINYLYHLAGTIFKDYPNLQVEFVKAIQWKTCTKPNGETPTKVNLQTDPTVKMLLGEECPTFRLAIQALHKMDTEEFRLLNNVMGICHRIDSETQHGRRSVEFLMTFASLHSSPMDDHLERDIARLQTPEKVGFLLTFGPMSMVLNNAKELEEVGYGSVVAKVQRAAGLGLQAVMDGPDSETLQGLAYDAKRILALKDVIDIPPKLEDFLRQAVEEKNKPRQERQPERVVKQPTNATQGKSGSGMSYDAVEAHLRINGLTPIAGGTKYTYWGLPGTSTTHGTFIRLAAKTVRLVERHKDGRKLNDDPLTEEAYYGKLTPELVDTLIASLKRKSSPG